MQLSTLARMPGFQTWNAQFGTNHQVISMSSCDHADGHGDYSSGQQSLLFLRQEYGSKPGCVEGVRILQQTRYVCRILVRYRVS